MLVSIMCKERINRETIFSRQPHDGDFTAHYFLFGYQCYVSRSVITITLSYHSILHINFQYYLMVDDLNTKLSNIPEDLSVIDDVSYQERIGKNLKQIIEDLLIIQE
nr:unnamed protein product [Callosobruchus analis]